MPVIDASSILRAWDEYPIAQFPGFWRWIAEEVGARRWVMTRPNLAEVDHKSPDCAVWLRDNQLSALGVNQPIATVALNIRTELRIEADGYHPDGVDEKDILLIATCRVNVMECISDEATQHALPPNRRRYKIPAVCAIRGVDVPCVNLTQAIRRSGIVFDDFRRPRR